MLKRFLILLALLTWPVLVSAAPAPVQLAKMTGTISGTSGTTAAFGSSTTTGNSIIAFARLSTATVSSITYSVGSQSCTSITSDTTQDPHVFAYICQNITGGASATCSITISGADAYGYVACEEVSGVPTSGVIETSVHGTGTGTLDLTVGGLTTSTANDMLLYYVSQNSLASYAAGASYTLIDGAIVSAGGLEYQNVTGTVSSYTSHFDASPGPTSGPYSGIVLAIKGATAAVASPARALLGVGK